MSSHLKEWRNAYPSLQNDGDSLTISSTGASLVPALPRLTTEALSVEDLPTAGFSFDAGDSS
jgi:hypothetical protein